MQATELKKLHIKRGSLKARNAVYNNFLLNIEDHFNVTKTLEEDTQIEIQLRLSKCELCLEEINQIQGEIETIVDDIQPELIERENIENSFYKTITKATLLLKLAFIENDDQHSSVGSQHSNADVSNISCKLPTMQLPKFHGTYETWMEFRDSFNSLVHNNQRINEIQKFQCVITSLEISAANYTLAWSLLCERFENKRLLVHNHVKALHKIPELTKESSTKLRSLLDTLNTHVRSLQVLGEPTQHWDTLLIYIIASKFDVATNREWELEQTKATIKDLKDMKDFIKNRADFLEKLKQRATEVKPISKPNSRNSSTSHAFLSTGETIQCAYCRANSHRIYNCQDFMKLEVCNRIKEIKQRKLCLNCLRSGHFNEDCRSSNCRKCNSKHNTLLHFEQRNNQAPAELTQVALPAHTNLTSQVLLSTAEIRIQGKRGTFHTCRALLDSGSQSNIITETLCNKLGCYTSPIHIAIVGVNQAESIVKTKCNLKFKSRHGEYTDSVTCLVMPKICGNIPRTTINISTVNIPSNLKLADPIFNESSPVDVLLGAGTFWKLLRAGQIQLGKQMPILQNTKLGWIVSGSIAKQHTPVIHVNLNIDVDKQLSRFWEVEEGFPKHPFSEEERECERHFLATQHRNAECRFIVSIPMKNSLDKLGESRDTAIRRFYSLERKLQLNHQMKQRYVQFMQEYLDMGHMSVVPTRDNSQYTYYLPHHGVMKEECLTTKLRVVFDGSAATSSGWSINNLQMIGPTIQNDLFSILIRFRQHTYVVSAGIAKMYRQVLVEKKHLYREYSGDRTHMNLYLNTI